MMALLVFAGVLLPVAQPATMDNYKSLITDLFTTNGYKKELRPLVDDFIPLKVYIGIKLSSIQDLDEINQKLTFSAFLYFDWIDPNLSWDPASYNYTYYFAYPQKELWIPDVTILNSVESMEELGFDRNYMYVSFDGLVQWLPAGVFSTSCDIDVTYYPFDTQECSIIFTTLVSTSGEVDLDSDHLYSADLSQYSESGTWDLVSLCEEKVSDGNSTTRVAFVVKLQRLRSYYVLSIIVPVIFLAFTSTLVFALPADSGEKMGTSITVLLAFAVYLTLVSDQMPKTSTHVSLLAVYLTMLLGMTAAGVVLTVWILNLHFRDDDKHPPGPRMRRIAIFCQRLMRKRPWNDSVQPLSKQNEDANVPPLSVYMKSTENGTAPNSRAPTAFQRREDLPSPNEPEMMTWKETSLTFDRFLFYVSTLFIILITVVFMIALAAGGAST